MDYEELKAYIERAFSQIGVGGEDGATLQPLSEDLPADLPAEVSQEDYLQALDEVMEEQGIPEDVRQQVADRFVAADNYGPAGIQQHLTFVINDDDVTNHIDQSLNIDGEVHGDINQANESNVANATGEGAIAGEEVHDNQVQTGDGQQVGGDSGVQNQGNNSGQQAGYDATADNVTTGNGNTVGSDNASRIGAEQVSQDHADIDDSAQAFGHGSADNQADDIHDSQNTLDENITDSFNSEATSTETVDVNAHVNVEDESYEQGYEHEDYHVDENDDYKSDDDDYDDDLDDVTEDIFETN